MLSGDAAPKPNLGDHRAPAVVRSLLNVILIKPANKQLNWESLEWRTFRQGLL